MDKGKILKVIAIINKLEGLMGPELFNLRLKGLKGFRDGLKWVLIEANKEGQS